MPGLLASGFLIWLQPWSLESRLILFGAELFAGLLIGVALHDHIVRPLQTLANVVGALRDEHYSFRARLAVPNDALGELSLEVNALADLLAKHRTGAIEAAALLQRVVEEVDIPIFAFDPANKLRLVLTSITNGVAATATTKIGYHSGNDAYPVQPKLQRQDGTYVGSLLDGSMVVFDISGNLKWKTRNYTPTIATADGGVIAQSWDGTNALFDQNGGSTGQMANLPTQSWLGNSYRLGSILP